MNELSAGISADLRQVLVELEMMSHISAVNLNPGSRDSSEGIGGKRPPGGVDRREDRYRPAPGETTDDERVLRSADHFRRQLAKGRNPEYVLEEAREALAAFRRPPKPRDKGHPMPADFNWKRWVAESDLPSSEIARKCGVTGQYVRRIRKQYRDAA